MLHDFIEWLSDQITELGLAKVLFSLTALLGAAGAVGNLFGPLPLRAAALVAVLLAALALNIAILTEHKANRAELTAARKLLTYYCDLVERQLRLKLEVALWHQTISINQRGDAVVTRRLTVTSAGDELHFLAARLCYYGSTPLTARRRRRVRATAREFTEGVEGPRLITTSSWRDDREHQILIHFSGPVPAGVEISVEVKWKWPRFSADLMQGEVEDFDISFAHPVDIATQRVILLKRTSRDRFLVSRIGKRTFELNQTDATCQVSFTIEQPEIDVSYGVRIDKAR